jgi:hypothetical protein
MPLDRGRGARPRGAVAGSGRTLWLQSIAPLAWGCAEKAPSTCSGGRHGPTCVPLGLSIYQVFERSSPPASGGLVHTTLTDRRGREAEPVRRGIRRTRPNNRSHGTRTEIAGHIVFREASNPCARQMATVSTGDQSCQATAGAKGTKGASAHLRCGSMVSGVGSAAFKGSVGTAAFGRAARLGCGLAHPGDGLFAGPSMGSTGLPISSATAGGFPACNHRSRLKAALMAPGLPSRVSCGREFP